MLRKKTPRAASKRKALKFISDSDSGTIIVQGADVQQLKVIEELINIYDQPLATDGKQVRKTQVFTLKYSKATILAEAVKDVYRDLLSTNDKAYQNNQPAKDGQKPAAAEPQLHLRLRRRQKRRQIQAGNADQIQGLGLAGSR